MNTETHKSIIPETVNPSPDYYCTWQTQLYAVSGGSPAEQRNIMSEHSLFNRSFPYGWAYFYEKTRKDLFFVMDDSWDVPVKDYEKYYGTLLPDHGKFPLATTGRDGSEALRYLTDKVKALGWKGLGGWVCAQEPLAAEKYESPEEYWVSRLKTANEAGFSYWKVDWGEKGRDIEFRKALPKLGRIYAPKLVIENAVLPEVIPFSDAFRTYDVPALMSIPMTIEKIELCARGVKPNADFSALLNCEDEAYIAAAGGFTMGIMRHPFAGDFPDGYPDRSFPAVHRGIKTKLTEITRAARWHRIAPAFALDSGDFIFDNVKLSDTWRFDSKWDEIEHWWLNILSVKDFLKDDVLTKTAAARIARRCSLPEVVSDGEGNVPFTVCSRNPSGAYSIATAGRTVGRRYYIPECRITADTGDSIFFGIFGNYSMLTLLSSKIKRGARVLAQDLAADTAVEITKLVETDYGRLTIPGSLIAEIGTLAQPADDTSEPGLAVMIAD